MNLKTILTFLLISIVLNNKGNSQTSSTFKFTDTNVFVGQKKIITNRLEFTFCRWEPVDYNHSEKLLDSIGYFLCNNPDVVIEIGRHTDQRGADNANLKLSQRQAEGLKFEICKKNKINEDRIIAIGYGELNPVISLDSIIKIPKLDREFLYKMNRRFELKILKIIN